MRRHNYRERTATTDRTEEGPTSPMPRPQAPLLELVWPNKDQFLLAPKDDTGKPVWVPRTHPAASEVRLVEFTGAHGEVSPESRAVADSLLFTGDSLDVLRSLAEHPEYRREYRGRIKCVYIDPPFNTGQTFEHYDDWMEHSTWLSFMRDRLLLIKDLLAPDGIVWVHLDSTEVHRARCLLDEVFGAGDYLGTVVWQRTSAKSLAKRTMGTMHESLLVYGASDQASLTTLYVPPTEEYVAKRYTQRDDRGRYDTGDLTATSHRPHLDSGKPWRGFDPSSIGRCWAVPRAPLKEAGLEDAAVELLTMRQKLDALDEAGYVHWPAGGGFPRLKRYLHSVKGRTVGDLWTDINVINSQAAERTAFSTQKPEALLQRVIAMSSSPGDIVLDVFGGSGTTAAAAAKLKRRWVTSELLPETVAAFIEPRLRRVVDGADPAGITPAAGWTGGGGFRSARIVESMYDVADGGVVLLSARATNGTFARAMAAQLDFDFEPDAAPFCGRRGRMRLAVLDGSVGPDEARLLAQALGEAERVTVVGKVVLPGTEELLASLSRGSRVRKAPRDVLADGLRRTRRRDRTKP